MKIKFSKPTVYVSHPIMGFHGDVENNCSKAHRIGEKLRKLFPEVYFYIPASENLVSTILYNKGILTIEQILEADLEILSACHGYLCLMWEESSGSRVELWKAEEIGLTSGEEDVVYDDWTKANYSVIRNRVSPIVDQAIKNYWRK